MYVIERHFKRVQSCKMFVELKIFEAKTVYRITDISEISQVSVNNGN